MRLALASLFVQRRHSLGYTQAKVAKLLGSSQSRIAKLEAGDPSVSVDLMLKSLLKLGASRRELGRVIGTSPVKKSA
jgi:transcriptional regulator with XRE-family HTH domain